MYISLIKLSDKYRQMILLELPMSAELQRWHDWLHSGARPLPYRPASVRRPKNPDLHFQTSFRRVSLFVCSPLYQALSVALPHTPLEPRPRLPTDDWALPTITMVLSASARLLVYFPRGT